MVIGPKSAWFSGHFPGDPIVPGVAQLGMVLDVLQQACEQTLAVTEISRIRFRRIIRPDEPIQIHIAPATGNEGAYAFRLMAAGEMICNGFMKVKVVTKN